MSVWHRSYTSFVDSLIKMSAHDSSIYAKLPRSSELLPLHVVKLASKLFAGETGLSGRQIFEFFSRYSDEIGKLRYGRGGPSRWIAFEEFLEHLPIHHQRHALLELCNGYPMRSRPPASEIDRLRAMIEVGSVGGPTEASVKVEPVSVYDVFICHASEDKSFTDQLAAELRKVGITVWYDQFSLSWGDDLRVAIDAGLASSRFGVVIFSPAFLKKKKWTEHELNGLFAKEKAGVKVILPIWHNITEDDLVAYSPSFANRLAKDTSTDSPSDIAKDLQKKLEHYK